MSACIQTHTHTIGEKLHHAVTQQALRARARAYGDVYPRPARDPLHVTEPPDLLSWPIGGGEAVGGARQGEKGARHDRGRGGEAGRRQQGARREERPAGRHGQPRPGRPGQGVRHRQGAAGAAQLRGEGNGRGIQIFWGAVTVRSDSVHQLADNFFFFAFRGHWSTLARKTVATF